MVLLEKTGHARAECGMTEVGNGQFTGSAPMGQRTSRAVYSRHGDQRIEVLAEETCGGSVRLVNCAFWGPARQCVVSHNGSFVSLNDC